ncbi:MAG: hypothetical protein JKX85_05660 [Phycisphaeraceae bacterium]|nr:hypothetical protein [Phycisphaeraceae bacterium]
MKKQRMLIGWGTQDVTPKGKVSLLGQFRLRITDEIHDPLTTSALAMESEDGSEQAIIVSLPTIGVADYILAGCREMIAEKIVGFNPDKLFVSATHPHTAPEYQANGLLGESVPLPDDVMTDRAYGAILIEKISLAAIEAWNSRKVGALSWGYGHAVIGFNRRASFFDGSSVMYGNSNTPEFSHREGAENHGVDMLFTYDTEHKLTGMLINVPCPAQCSEAKSFISSDYWHDVCKVIRERHGENIYILPQCAAAGDISPRAMINVPAVRRMMTLKGYSEENDIASRQLIAQRLAAAVDEILPLASKDIQDELAFGHEVIRTDLPRRLVSEQELVIAKQEVVSWSQKLEEIQDMDHLSVEYSAAFRHRSFNLMVIGWHQDQQQGKQLTMPVELHCLRIGEIAMCTNPFEFYIDFAMRIMARSNALQTFVVQLAGSGTYLPTERAKQGGSYSAFIASTPVGPDGGQVIVEQEVQAINQMFPESCG